MRHGPEGVRSGDANYPGTGPIRVGSGGVIASDPRESLVTFAVPALVPTLALATTLALAGCTSTQDADEPADSPAPSASSPTPSKKRMSPTSEPTGDPVAGCEATTEDQRVPEEFWGMHVASPIGEAFPDAPVSVVNLTTAQTYWPNVETAPGVRSWDRLDSIVATAEDNGATPVLVLGFSPDFHSTGSGETARSVMPDVKAWESYVRAVAERYGDRIAYQIWPEPNIVSNWSGTPAEMAELTIRAGDVLDQAAPGATVVAAATTLRLGSQRRWMDRFWGASYDGRSPADVADVAAIDPFPKEKGTPEDSVDLVCEAVGILEKHGADVPVWTNEINYGVPSGGGATDVSPYPDAKQAAYVARTYLLNAAVGVDSAQWLGWARYPGMAIAMTEEDGATPTAAALAFSAVHDWLAGGPRPVCTVERKHYTCTTPDLVIHWSVGKEMTVPVPEGVRQVRRVDGTSGGVPEGGRVTVGQQPVAFVVR